MHTNRMNGLRIGVLLLIAHWFFGNLYEMVVFVPNFLFGSLSQSLELWNRLTWLTNPIFYFQPLNTLLQVLVWVLARQTTRQGTAQAGADRKAAWGITAAGLLTVLIVTTVNIKLYFSVDVPDSSAIERTYYLGVFLGLLRLAAEGYALRFSVAAIRGVAVYSNPSEA